MGQTHDIISPPLKSWLESQHVFFVATAPLAPDGHVNCSPKGCDTFRVVNDREVAYLDMTGSGIETIAHLQENGRIVIMFCAFDGAPKIARLHGTGTVVYPSDPKFGRLAEKFPAQPGVRAIIHVSVARVSTSCGYGVPLLDFVGERDALGQWCDKKGPEGLDAYRREKNSVSIDEIPGYDSPTSSSAPTRPQ